MAAPTLRQRFSPRRFLRGLGPAAGPHRTRAGNVYILPTRSGFGFLVVLALMLTGAINYGNGLAFAFTFLLASVAVTGIVHTWRNLHGLTIRVQPAAPVFAGRTPQLAVIIDNPGPPRPALEMDLRGRRHPVRLTAGGGQTVARLELPPGGRGRHPMPAFEVSTRYPLSLFRAWTIVHPSAHYLIWPAPAERAPSPPEGHATPGAGSAAASGRDDFAGLRDYRRGDSLHHVHWKVSARQSSLVVKTFHGRRSDEIRLDWAALAPADGETRLRLLTRQLLDAEARGLRYALRLPGVEIPAGRGEAHRHRCLERLALHRP